MAKVTCTLHCSFPRRSPFFHARLRWGIIAPCSRRTPQSDPEQNGCLPYASGGFPRRNKIRNICQYEHATAQYGPRGVSGTVITPKRIIVTVATPLTKPNYNVNSLSLLPQKPSFERTNQLQIHLSILPPNAFTAPPFGVGCHRASPTALPPL